MIKLLLKFDKWLGTKKGRRFSFITLLIINVLALMSHLL